MSGQQQSALERLEQMLKSFWKKNGNPQVIAARHTEFVVEPKVFLGDKLNPEVLELLALNYLKNCTRQDSGMGSNVDVSPERIVIKTPKGKPVVVIRSQKIIRQFLDQ